MKNKVSVFLFFISLALVYVWFFRVLTIYFEFTHADQISIFLVFIIPAFLGWKIIKTNKLTSLIGLVATVLILITIQPFITYTLGRSEQLWVWVHAVVIICGLSVSLVRYRWSEITVLITALSLWFIPYRFEPSQIKYFDKVTASVETRKGEGHIVTWKGDHWLHYNAALKFSTLDSHILRECLIDPVMHLNNKEKDILIIGGDDGLAVSELNKFSSVNRVTMIPYDIDFHYFVRQHQNLLSIQLDDRLDTAVLDIDPFRFMMQTSGKFDVIIIDMPVNNQNEIKMFYSQEFYKMLSEKLNISGFIVTRSYNPYLEHSSWQRNMHHLQEAGFYVIPYHTQVPTMGQCAWLIGSKNPKKEVLTKLKHVEPMVRTKWWNQEAMRMILKFGKHTYFSKI